MDLEELRNKLEEFKKTQIGLKEAYSVFKSGMSKEFRELGDAGIKLEESIKRQYSLIEQLKAIGKEKAVDEYKLMSAREYEELTKQSTFLKKALTGLGAALVGVKMDFENLGYSIVDFYMSGSQQLKHFEKQEKSIRDFARNVGVLGGGLDTVSGNMRQSLPFISRYGGSMDEVAAIMKDLADTSGRVTFLSDQDIEKSYALQKALGLAGSEVASITDNMSLFGKGTISAVDEIQKLADGARKMGLNSKEVVKELSSNMDKAGAQSFRNGIKGMTEMAKHAVNLRMDMGEILGMAQNLWTPEKAIETAAELQVLGGDFAKEFGDPFKLLYAARNEPEQLVKSMEKAISSVYQFNEATGEFKAAPMELQRLQIAAGKLGLDFNRLNKSARQAAKASMIEGSISFNATDDERAFLANIANIDKDGRATVTVKNEEGRFEATLLENLSREQLEELQASQIANEGEYFTKSMEQYETQTELMQGIYATAKAQLVDTNTNAYLLAEGLLKDATQKGVGLTGDLIKNIKDHDGLKGLKESEMFKGVQNIFNKDGGDYDKIIEISDKEGRSGTNKALQKVKKEKLDGLTSGLPSEQTVIHKYEDIRITVDVTGVDTQTEAFQTAVINDVTNNIKNESMNIYNDAGATYKTTKT